MADGAWRGDQLKSWNPSPEGEGFMDQNSIEAEALKVRGPP